MKVTDSLHVYGMFSTETSTIVTNCTKLRFGHCVKFMSPVHGYLNKTVVISTHSMIITKVFILY